VTSRLWTPSNKVISTERMTPACRAQRMTAMTFSPPILPSLPKVARLQDARRLLRNAVNAHLPRLAGGANAHSPRKSVGESAFAQVGQGGKCAFDTL
jgi:hypothetical protein